jgi:hypothetical protein
VIAVFPALMRSLLASMPASAIHDGSLETWGPIQVLGHLIDVESIGFRDRISLILAEDHPYIHSIDPTARLVEGGFESRSLTSLLDQFDQMRRESIEWLRSLDPAELERSGEHDEAGEIKGSEFLHYWACHDLLHLRQMLMALQKRLEPHIGNTKKFFEDS